LTTSGQIQLEIATGRSSCFEQLLGDENVAKAAIGVTASAAVLGPIGRERLRVV
jgi:phosphopantothenate synthetase